MANTITIRTDNDIEHALGVLIQDGASRSTAIRQAILEAAARRERAADLVRAALRMPIGEPDGVVIADQLARERAGER